MFVTMSLVVNSNLAVLYSDTNNISIENSEIMATSKNFSLYIFQNKFFFLLLWSPIDVCLVK